MAEEIELAVAFALDPQTEVGTKSQATAFCEQVKVSPEGWRVCLELTTKEQPKR